MKLVILTEGFHNTGYGHISRCLALASSFRERAIEVTFIVYGDECVVSLLHEYSCISFNWGQDIHILEPLLQPYHIALIDSYLVEKRIYELIYQIVPLCIYLDDYNRLDYPPGIIMNGTVGAEGIPYSKKSGSTYLLGKDYVILREPFKHKIDERKISKEINTILITFGGTDPLNLTGEVLLKMVNFSSRVKKIVILGPAFSHVQEIEAIADEKTEIYFNVDAEEMKRLMLKSDLAISAAGQTINELAITGLPSIIFKVAENQKNNITGWMQCGFIDSFIDATLSCVVEGLGEYIQRMIDPSFRSVLSKRGKNIIDGKGTERLVRKSLSMYAQTYMHVARAQEKDLMALFDLANDTEVRNNSFSTQKILLDEHKKWFYQTLKNPVRSLYVFYVQEVFVGQIRFDHEKIEEGIVSISLMASFRGLGMGPFMLKMALDKLKKEQRGLKRIYAFIKKENTPSQLAFLKAGFQFVKEENANLKYVYEM